MSAAAAVALRLVRRMASRGTLRTDCNRNAILVHARTSAAASEELASRVPSWRVRGFIR